MVNCAPTVALPTSAVYCCVGIGKPLDESMVSVMSRRRDRELRARFVGDSGVVGDEDRAVFRRKRRVLRAASAGARIGAGVVAFRVEAATGLA